MSSSVGVAAVQRVLVVGSGTAGTSIVNAVARRSQHFHTSLLVTADSLDRNHDKFNAFKSHGVHLVQGELTASLAELTGVLTGADVAISCLTHERYGTTR
jgi:saccharopine dehydrogenase-like NADP-dependent oxidoreductase